MGDRGGHAERAVPPRVHQGRPAARHGHRRRRLPGEGWLAAGERTGSYAARRPHAVPGVIGDRLAGRSQTAELEFLRGAAMSLRFRAIVVGLGVVLAGTALLAHHGTNASYDPKKELTLTGTVTKFVMMNPHGQLFFDVKG